MVFDMLTHQESLDSSSGLAEVLEKDETEFEAVNYKFELRKKIEEVIRKQQALMKEDIKILCSLVEEDKEKLSNDDAREEYIQKERDVKLQVEKAKQHKEEIQQECQTLHQEMATCQKGEQKLKEEREAVENNTTSVLPTIRYGLNLFNMICRIRWQYDSSPDDVSGYVCNKKDVKPFSLSTKQNSQFFIANYLWDMIEESADNS